MEQGLSRGYVMFARTTRGQDRSNGGRLLRVENINAVSGSTSALIIRINVQADENSFWELLV